jgi:hypothetical protein
MARCEAYRDELATIPDFAFGPSPAQGKFRCTAPATTQVANRCPGNRLYDQLERDFPDDPGLDVQACLLVCEEHAALILAHFQFMQEIGMEGGWLADRPSE